MYRVRCIRFGITVKDVIRARVTADMALEPILT